VPLHLVATLSLLAALTLVAWYTSGGAPARYSNDRSFGRLAFVAMAGVVVLSATGAVTALADTLFPADSLAEGLAADFSSEAEFLTRLRVLHPIVSVLVAAYVVWLARTHGMEGDRTSRRAANAIVGVVAVQLVVGVVNVVTLTPEPIQLVHLFLADLLWIALIVLTVSRLGAPATVEARVPSEG
jgi:heme A synthase